MDENEKVFSTEETVTPEESGCPVQNPECAETESPALAISEAADAAEEGKNYREMSKDELLKELRAIVDEGKVNSHKEVAALKQRFYFLRNAEIEAEMKAYLEAGNPVDAFAAMPDASETEFKDLLNTFKEKRSEYLAGEEERKQENLELKKKIIAQVRSLAEDIDNINLHFPKFKQLQLDFKNIDNIPESAVKDTWKDFQEVVEMFYDRFKMNKELRDLDFKKNLEAKRELIEEAKRLADLPDVVEAESRLQTLHNKWRELGPIVKELREEVWEEFKAVSTVINKRHQAFFEERKAQEKENEQVKTELCEKIEAIDLDGINTFAQWEEKTKEIIDMQARWKETGYASRKSNNLLFARFRKACDEFFARKSEAYKKTRDELNENLRKKTELCEKAEALKEAGDIKEGMKKVLELQAEWKEIGTVPRKYNEQIWNRFRAACNYFFEERRKQTASVRKSENENLAAKREIIEALKAIDLEQDKNEAARQVKELQSKWQSIGFVPFRDKEKIQKEYRGLLDEIYGKLDLRYTRDRLSRFEERMSGADARPDRERDKLVRALENRRAELKTYENNLGFFNVKSKEGEQMVSEMKRKMARVQSDIDEISQKIALLDSKKDESEKD